MHFFVFGKEFYETAVYWEQKGMYGRWRDKEYERNHNRLRRLCQYAEGLAGSVGKKPDHPIEVASLPAILEDIRQQGTKYGSMLAYYEAKGLVYTTGTRVLEAGDIQIEMIPVDEQEHVTVFVITSDSKKIIYAPCDVKPFPKSDKLQGADVLIIGNTIVGDVLKDGFVLQEDNPLRKELFTLNEIEEIREQYAVPEVIITHLEEDWGKSYDDYRELEKEWKFIRFAYDGLKIPL